MPLVDQSMLAERETIISHIDNNGVFLQTIVFQPGSHCSDTLVQCHQRLQVGFIKFVEGDLAMIHIIHAMPAIALLTHPFRNILEVHRRFRRADNVSIEFAAVGSGKVHRRRRHYRKRVVHSFVSFRRLKFCMNRLMGKVEHKWLIFLQAFQPINGLLRQQIGSVSSLWLGDSLSIDVKGGIKIGALAPEAQPLVKAGLWHIIRIAHVPLAKKSGLIAELL